MRARMSDKPDEAVLNAHDQIVQSAGLSDSGALYQNFTSHEG
jgi:hypothetical protein